jgi:hypothetical protein
MRKVISALSLIVFALVTGCGGTPQEGQPGGFAGAPRNPYLTNGLYKMTHGDSYNSDAVSVAGPTSPSMLLGPEHYDLIWTGPIAAGLFDYAYPNGRRVIWAPKPDRIMKMEIQGGALRLLQEYRLPPGKFPYVTKEAIQSFIEAIDATELAGPAFKQLAHRWAGYEFYAISRAMYSMLGEGNILYVGGGDRITAYGDAEPGDPDSAIVKLREVVFDPSQLNQPRGFMFGINMSYDGHIITVSRDGTIIAFSRDFERSWYYRLPKDELIWNGFSVDEKGGVYFASSKKLYKLIWTGEGFGDKEEDGAWSVPYEIGPFDASRRAGRGTGTAPSLMGGPTDRDRFVVSADGANVNNIVLYWRDEIPEDWEQLPGTLSRRVAGKLPANFGNPQMEDSYSENSVLIAGYGAVVANNSLQDGTPFTIDMMLQANEPSNAPYGIMKFAWDTKTRKWSVAWVNRETSIANSTPVISTATNRIYLAGQRDGVWTGEAIDYDTGKTAAIYTLGRSQRFNPTYPDVQLLYTGDLAWPAFGGILRLRLPDAKLGEPLGRP